MSLLPVVMPERAVAVILAVGWALVLFLGQGLLIGLAAAALLRALKARSAELRYGIACVGLLVMALCPVLTTLRGLAASRGETGSHPAALAVQHRAIAADAGRIVEPPRTESAGAAVQVANLAPERAGAAAIAVPGARWAIAATGPGWRERVEAWLPVVVVAWLAGVCVLGLRLLNGLVEVRALTCRGLIAPGDEFQATIVRLVDRAGLRRPVEWFLSLQVEVPAVVGWLRPKVLIPAGSLARLTLGQVEALLAHEIAHIRRYDYLVNMLQVAVESLLFFHPAVWWISRRIRDERENCCDDMAVAICGGDRLLVARALFAMEEQRAAPILRVAASGGSLRDRVRRLVAPASAACPAESGLAGAGLLTLAFLLVAVTWLAGPSQARDDVPRAGTASVHGRVLDEADKPVAGTRVRLYLRTGRWERHHPVIEETTTGADGSFELRTVLKPLSPSQSRDLAPYVVLADHAGKAVGCRTIPKQAATFEGDIILTAPTERTITVIDGDERPVPDVKVEAYSLGDPSSPTPLFQDMMELLRPDDGPLTAMTDANGRATFRQLPRTNASFVATKPGFAEGYAFREQATIHLSPSALLSGSLTGSDGQPLPGVKIVLFTDFMWDFEHAVTDDKGRFAFADLKARGWDMSAWGPHAKPGNGAYKVWIDSDRYAVPTQVIALEPGERETLDLQAQRAGVIRATVAERGTGKPVAGVRIWGWDATTGGSGRFNAYTDEKGRATLYSTPAKISLSIAGPPEGYYIKAENGGDGESSKQIDFQGGEAEVALIMSPIAGPVIAVSGNCTRPDGTPAAGAAVYPTPVVRFITSGSMSFIRMRRVDAAGRFTLEGVPAGQAILIYAETEDRKFAGTARVQIPEKAGPGFRLKVPLAPTVTVHMVAEDKQGNLLPSKKFHVSPRVADKDFPFVRRSVESDEQGRVKIDGVVRGLSYKVQEDVPPSNGPVAFVGGRPPGYEEVIVLAPETGK